VAWDLFRANSAWWFRLRWQNVETMDADLKAFLTNSNSIIMEPGWPCGIRADEVRYGSACLDRTACAPRRLS